MLELTLRLRDRNAPLAEAWSRHFRGLANVEISAGDIFGVSADAIVSPANSFGFMDGGIDLAYSQRFGWELSERLREQLQRDHDGELPVGQALLLETFDEEIPWLICAPTMRVPMVVADTVNAYLAFRAALRAVVRHNQSTATPIRSLLCPGLGTAIGAMPYERCARQMHAAYQAIALGQRLQPLSLGQAVDVHHLLLA
jgi:O-acetyl-ADP-ribose deacetylase (regulator of RNase III)